MDISEKLKNLRGKTEYNKSEMAKQLKLSRSVYMEVENGTREPSKDVLKKVSDYFNVSVDWLMGKTENPEKENITEEKSNLLDSFLDNLIEEGIITDPNNIDDETATMIINAVKAQVALKMKKRGNK